jgi:hypothetical protein
LIEELGGPGAVKSQAPEDGRHITTKDQPRKNGSQHLYISHRLFLSSVFPHFSSLSLFLSPSVCELMPPLLSLPLRSQLRCVQLFIFFCVSLLSWQPPQPSASSFAEAKSEF